MIDYITKHKFLIENYNFFLILIMIIINFLKNIKFILLIISLKHYNSWYIFLHIHIVNEIKILIFK
jgi:hypothetical protein